jgi:N-acetylmuramoyl-L-alanine amidase
MEVKMKKHKNLISIIVLGIILYLILARLPMAYAISQYGSSGDEVKQIQTKLKDWGYYSGNVDGIYGSKTYEAVKKFQQKNGLTVDGIAGSQTLAAMGINSSSSSGSSSSNNSDLNLLSHLVYAEARGEPYNGMVAVAATVMNRVSDSRFPNSVSGVIYQSGAYTCVSDGQINLDYNDSSKKAAQDAINGWDPTSRLYLLF